MNSSVGYEWDVKIVTADKVWEVSSETKKLVEQVWAKFNRSPFEKRQADDIKPPPRDWNQRLNEYFSRMTNRIPKGKVRTLMANGSTVEGPMSPEVEKMRRNMKKLLRKNAKRSGARNSKRGQ